MSKEAKEMNQSDKYRAFRNFMVNELGVTREDIEAWTKQSVATEVDKILSGMNVGKMAARAIDSSVKAIVKNSANSYFSTANPLQKAIAQEISNRLLVDIKVRNK